MRSSTVTALLVAHHGDTAEPGKTAVSLGTVLDNGIVAWGHASLELDPATANQLLMHAQAQLLPALQAAPLTRFRDATARIAAGDLPAPLRCAADESVLAAIAQRDGTTMTAVIGREYDLTPAAAPVPLIAALRHDDQAAALCRLPAVAALALPLPARHAAVVLGADGSQLQRRVRALCARISRTGATTALHLTLRGGFGRLFGEETGKALGALYGLERTCGTVALTVEDALPPAPAHAAAWRELRTYLSFRKLRTRLMAGAGIDGPATVTTVAEAGAVDGVHVQLDAVAGLDAGIRAILAARRHGLDVLLSAPNPVTLAHVALATRPDGVWVDGGAQRPFAVQVEMQRAAAWRQFSTHLKRKG